jgi:uncharacterized membrane protein required for colicin V production
VILIVISILLLWNGYRHGFIRAAGSLLGLVISIWIGIWGVTWLEDVTGFNLTANPVTFIFTFLILSVIVSQVIRLIVGALDLVRRLFSIIPFVGLINSFLGLMLGAVQAALLIGTIAYITVTYLPSGEVRTILLGSQLVDFGVMAEEQLGVL